MSGILSDASSHCEWFLGMSEHTIMAENETVKSFTVDPIVQQGDGSCQPFFHGSYGRNNVFRM